MLINLISHHLWTTGKVYQQSLIAEILFYNNNTVMSYGRFYNSKWTDFS